MEDETMRLALRTLSVLRSVRSFPPVRSFIRMIDGFVQAKRPAVILDRCAQYASDLLPYGGRLSTALKTYLESDGNICVKAAQAGEMLQPETEAMLDDELHILSEACTVSPGAMQIYLDYDGSLPVWTADQPDLQSWYRGFLNTVQREGSGIYRHYHVFRLGSHGRVIPVESYDRIELSSLQGYEWQRELVVKDIEALLAGEPAVDMLLYGDSGTGKSSTVKAAANRYAKDGLRLIEVRPAQLHHIPKLLEILASNPLKFLLFIDDLSFTKEDSNFRALKGTLEGSVVSRADNVVICATSNRRHLIRESFRDRGSDDVHANETIQQTVSLSDRFGLSIPFMNPKKDAYLAIVKEAAAKAGLDMPEDELVRGAERFAIEKGGRSGRAAVQYVDLVKAGLL